MLKNMKRNVASCLEISSKNIPIEVDILVQEQLHWCRFSSSTSPLMQAFSFKTSPLMQAFSSKNISIDADILVQEQLH